MTYRTLDKDSTLILVLAESGCKERPSSIALSCEPKDCRKSRNHEYFLCVTQMALNVSPQLQWPDEKTVGGLALDFVGLIKAAASDNIQPAALLACEQLGEILPPMSAKTRFKIGQLAEQKTNKPLDFMEARVGYFAGDSVDLLSKTSGGMRFLCFAAIILSCGKTDIQSAEFLETILTRGGYVGHPKPTLHQLLALLRALKPKLASVGFVKVVLGRRDWCVANGLWNPNIRGSCIPTGLCDFFISLGRVCRLGEDSHFVRVECSLSYFPWLIAAVEWIFGGLPKICRADGTPVIRSSQGGVSVVDSGDCESFRVFTIRRVDPWDLGEILYNDDTNPGLTPLRGMVDVHTWIKYYLEKINLPLSLYGRFLYTITKYLVPRIVLCTTMEKFLHKVDGTPVASFRSLAFHDFERRLSALRSILGGNIDLPEEDPNMDVMLEEIRRICICDVCLPKYSEGVQGSPPMLTSTNAAGRPAWCVGVLLGKFAAEVLTLSLFTIEHQVQRLPLVSFPPSRHSVILQQEQSCIEVTANSVGRAEWPTLITHGWRPVLTGKLRSLSCSSRSIIEHALSMVGYDGEKNAVLASSNGQVVYPAVLETGAAQKSGYLELRCIPGSVRWQGITIGALVSEERSHYRPTPDEPSVSMRPVRPVFPRSLSGFVPKPTHHDPLTYTLLLRHQQEPPSVLIHLEAPAGPSRSAVDASPWDLLDGIGQTIFSPSCSHRIDSPAGSLGEEFVLVRPGRDIRSYCPGDEPLLIDHHGYPLHQLLQLAGAIECCVLHQDGCIHHALMLAKKLGIKIVVC